MLRAPMHLETKNLVILTDCFNAFDTVNKVTTALAKQVATCVPALTTFVAKCYGERAAGVFFRVDSGEHGANACSREVQQGDPMVPAMLCLSLRPRMKRFRVRRSGRKESKPTPTWRIPPLGLVGITASTVRTMQNPSARV